MRKLRHFIGNILFWWYNNNPLNIISKIHSDIIWWLWMKVEPGMTEEEYKEYFKEMKEYAEKLWNDDETIK